MYTTSLAPHSSAYRYTSVGISITVTAFCVRTVSDTPETPVTHRQSRTHLEELRGGVKSLRESALMRVGVRPHARPESISKRAPSTTRTSLRSNGINSLP